MNKKDIIDDVKKWMYYAKLGKRDILYKTYEKFILLLEDEKKIIVDKIKTKYNDPNVINKGIFEGVHKKEIGNFINAGMAGSKIAFDMEANIKKDYEKGDYSIKAMLYQDPPKEKSLIRKIGEKMGLIEKPDDDIY